jgi:hypothetical protein
LQPEEKLVSTHKRKEDKKEKKKLVPVDVEKQFVCRGLKSSLTIK